MSMVSGMQRNSGMNEEKYMSNFNSGNRVINIQSQDCVSVALKQTLTAIQNNLICFLRSLGSRLNLRLEVFGFLFYSGNAAEDPQVSIMTCNQQAITRAKTDKKTKPKTPKICVQLSKKATTFPPGKVSSRTWPGWLALWDRACSSPRAHPAPSTHTNTAHKKFKTMHKR